MAPGNKSSNNRRVILVRHAKSSWSDPTLTDHKRPLADRGKKDAPAMGHFMLENGIIPDKILCSSAKRTIMTSQLIMQSMELSEDIINYDDRIYEDAEDTILSIICNELDSSVKAVMIIGHNPDMEYLVDLLTGKPLPYPKFSTAAVAVIDYNCNKWLDLANKKGALTLFKSPRML